MAKNSRPSEMTKMVQLLEEIGPNINKIARLSGQYKESVRYRYREKILNKGFGLQARVNYESLGLKRLEIVADLNSKYWPKSREFFIAMNELCFVSSYMRTVPDGFFGISASVPNEFVEPFVGLMSEFGRRDILKPIEVYTFDWFRNVPMRAEFYDFDMDKWDVDLAKSAKRALDSGMFVPSGKQKFDYIDLLLIKELQVDATRSLTEIGSKLGIHYKRLLRHYRHVIQRRLIHGFRTIWLGTRYDPRLDVVLKSKHRYLVLDLVVRNVSKAELSTLALNMRRIPFLWGDAGGDNYLAELAIPLSYTNEVLEYLRERLEPVRGRVRYFLGDFDDALYFTVSYQLYDRNLKRWTFDPERVLEGLRHFEQTVKQKVSS